MFLIPERLTAESPVYPAFSAFLFMYMYNFENVRDSPGHPESYGLWHAMFIIRAFSSPVISGLRPRPGASRRAFSAPFALYFFKHRITLFLLIPALSAIASSVIPSVFKRIMLALRAVCACTVLERTSDSK
jgi:hypothetical protein